MRFSALAHVYNNYYYDNSYGVASTYDAAVLMENNYFYSVNNPGRVDFSGDLGRIVARETSSSPATIRSRPVAPFPIRAATTRTNSPRRRRPDHRAGRRRVGKLPSTLATAAPSAVPAGQPDGFASVVALGQNGTTGGAGGPVVTATNSADFLDYIDTIGPMVIQVSGVIQISSKQGCGRTRRSSASGTPRSPGRAGLLPVVQRDRPQHQLHRGRGRRDKRRPELPPHLDRPQPLRRRGRRLGRHRAGADYVTVSWNHFDHADKSMLIGHSDGAASTDIGHLKVSIHHNFFDHSRQRHPRVRFGDPVHVYNNYFLGNALYGVASTENAGVLVEGNYFRTSRTRCAPRAATPTADPVVPCSAATSSSTPASPRPPAQWSSRVRTTRTNWTRRRMCRRWSPRVPGSVGWPERVVSYRLGRRPGRYDVDGRVSAAGSPRVARRTGSDTRSRTDRGARSRAAGQQSSRMSPARPSGASDGPRRVGRPAGTPWGGPQLPAEAVLQRAYAHPQRLRDITDGQCLAVVLGDQGAGPADETPGWG
ncbi:hypothetical protein NKG94_05985 [Micromonospora sp. M12]